MVTGKGKGTVPSNVAGDGIAPNVAGDGIAPTVAGEGVKASSSVTKDDPTVESTDGLGNKVGDTGKEAGETALAVEKANKADEAKEAFAKKQDEEAAREKDDKHMTELYSEPRVMQFVGDLAELGLSGLFNTFRIGDKWADVNVLEELTLQVIDGNNREVHILEEPAVVLSVHRGRLGEMLDLHTGINHGCCGTSLTDRRIELRQALEQAYGRRLVDDEHCVVVYMTRFDANFHDAYNPAEG